MRAARWWPGTSVVVRCVLLGVVTTFLVAWGLALWHPLARGTHYLEHGTILVQSQADTDQQLWLAKAAQVSSKELQWPPTAPRAWPSPWVKAVESGVGVRVGIGFGGNKDYLEYMFEWKHFGWPMPSMTVHRAFKDAALLTQGNWQQGVAVGELDPAARGDGRRRLPLRPIVVGFILDTAFWASVWFTAIAAAGMFRVRRRRAHEWCVKCGYPVAGLAVCPECGTSVKA